MKYFIWWLTQADYEKQKSDRRPSKIPKLIWDQVKSLCGRGGNFRLWVPKGINYRSMPNDIPQDHWSEFKSRMADAGGVVITGEYIEPCLKWGGGTNSTTMLCGLVERGEVLKMRDEQPELLAPAMEIERRAQTGVNRQVRGLGGKKTFGLTGSTKTMNNQNSGSTSIQCTPPAAATTEAKPRCTQHRYEVGSPIDTVEICIVCGDRLPCEPLVDSWTR